MSFQNLRKGQQVYILYKDDNPRLEIGKVTSLTQPIAKYPTHILQGQYVPELVMDLQVESNGNTYNFPQIPSCRDIVDYGNGNVVITCSKEIMANEIEGLRKHSEDIINSVNYHKNIVSCYERISGKLNPDAAEKKRQEQETQELRQELTEMKVLLTRLLADGGKTNKSK